MLHVLFTMDCEPAGGKASGSSRATWELSARSIEGFCLRLLNAGYPATLFLSPACAEEHAPLLEELTGLGIELGLHLHPEHLGDKRYKDPLGKYDLEHQQALIDHGLERFRDAIGVRPQSFRPGNFSANDATFDALFRLGFRQGSVSSPGRDVPRHAARWSHAPVEAHYVDPHDRLRPGGLPFLELPVTTDPDKIGFGGYAHDLCIESGYFDKWHRPIADRWIERLGTDPVPFPTLCIFTHNHFAYHRDDDPQSVTLEALLNYCTMLSTQYDIVPVTLAEAHEHFRALGLGTTSA